MDCSPPGSSIHGIFQARVPEWDAIAFSGERDELCKKKIFLSRVKQSLVLKTLYYIIAVLLVFPVMTRNHQEKVHMLSSIQISV